jgi:stage II sporulation protein AA (anti-sigma F factor antagonist)
MEIRTEKTGTVMSVALKGRLDAASSNSTEAEFLRMIDGGERALVIDLAELTYITSLGLAVLLWVAKRMRTVDGKLAVCSLQPAVQQVYEIAGFATIIPVYGTRDDAIAGLS